MPSHRFKNSQLMQRHHASPQTRQSAEKNQTGIFVSLYLKIGHKKSQ